MVRALPQSFLSSVLFVDQLKIFLICVLVGAIGFFARDVVTVCLLPMRGSIWVGRAYCAYEIAFFAIFSLVFLSISVIFHFPPFRGYMFLGILLGFGLYYKFLRIILEFFNKLCYNILAKRFRKRKNSVK